MPVTKEAIYTLAKNKMATDQVMVVINDAMNKCGLRIDNILDNATLLYNMMERYSRYDLPSRENIVHQYFRAAMYKKLITSRTDASFAMTQPGIHQELLNHFEQVNALIAQLQAQEAASGGMGGFGGSTGGLTLGQEAAPTNISLGGVGAPGAAIDLSGGAAQQTSAQTTLGGNATAQQPPQQPPVQPAAAPVVPTEKKAKNQVTPLLSMRANMESYEAHELRTPAAKVSFEPKKANAAIQQFLETEKWGDHLETFLNGEVDSVYFRGPEIMVQREYTTRRYLVGLAGRDEAVGLVRSLEVEIITAKTNLRAALESNDSERIIKLVTGAVNKIKEAIIAYHDEVVSCGLPEIIAAEGVRLANALYGMLNRQVHNALVLGTNRGKVLPASANIKAVELENTLDDMDFFAEDLLKRTVGDNGLTSEPDWFTDLFHLVATAVLKVDFTIGDDEVAISEEVVNIRIPGAYPSVMRHNVVTTQSLGCTHEPITYIYEAVTGASERPNVVLVTPTHEFILMSSGQIAAPIYY